MVKRYTQNQILRFIYGELCLTEHLETLYAIENDAALQEVHEQLHVGYKTLPKALFSPEKKSIEKILAYSK